MSTQTKDEYNNAYRDGLKKAIALLRERETQVELMFNEGAEKLAHLNEVNRCILVLLHEFQK